MDDLVSAAHHHGLLGRRGMRVLVLEGETDRDLPVDVKRIQLEVSVRVSEGKLAVETPLEVARAET